MNTLNVRHKYIRQFDGHKRFDIPTSPLEKRRLKLNFSVSIFTVILYKHSPIIAVSQITSLITANRFLLT